MLIASYICGFLGIISTLVIYQQKTRMGLLYSKLISDVIWCLHYVFISAYAGAAIAVIGFIRELVFINRDKKWARSWIWLALFLALSAGAGVLTWKNVFSILPCIASMLAVISFWIGKPKLSRIMSYPIAALMLTYDITFLAFMAIINEIITIVSSTVGIIRHDAKKLAVRESN